MLKSEKTSVTKGQSPERRGHPRAPIRSVAYIELDDDNAGLILNISEGGIGVQSAEMITGDNFQRMILRLPKLEQWIEAGGKLAWLSPSRKEAGIQLVDLSDDARKQIQNWIYSSSFRPGLPIEQGHFKIVWESNDQEALPVDSAPKDDMADIDAMFPSEKAVPPQRHPRVENDASITPPSLELGIAPGPVKRQVIPPPVQTPVESVLAEKHAAPSPNPVAQPHANEPVGRRSYHYPPLATDFKSSGDPFASVAQDTFVVASTASAASKAGHNDSAPSSSASRNEPIAPSFPLREHYRGLGYNPAPFEEPSGKGWLIAAIVLLVILGVGGVMAMGPNNVKAVLSRHLQAVSFGGPPPPTGAVHKSQEAAATEAPGNSGTFGGAPPQPLTNSGVDPAQQTTAPPSQTQEPPQQVEAPPTTTTVTGKVPKPPLNDAGAGGTASQSLTAQGESSVAEPPEDSEAITRRFQMEHSGSNGYNVTNSYPVPANQTSVPPHVAPSGPASTALPAETKSDRSPGRSVETNPEAVPAPAVTNSGNAGSLNAAGTVAVSSHFRSLRGEEPEATREREGLAVGQLISIHQPAYPLEAERSRTEGVVQLRATVDQLGKVEIVHAVSGPPVLLAAAIDAVREWRYAPTTVNGKAVESVNDVNIVFRLGNSAASPR